VQTEDDLHRSGLATRVAAEQADNLATRHIETHAEVHLNLAVKRIDLFEFEKRLVHGDATSTAECVCAPT
jgi:hypothetical protein